MDMMSLRRRVLVNQNKLMTAIGNPITFHTPLEKPLKECVVRFTPQQEGSGTPSPDNVREISGRSSVKLCQSGKNLCLAANGDDIVKWTYESQNRKLVLTDLPPDTPVTLSVTVNEALGKTTGRRLYLRGKSTTFIDTGSSSGRKSITVNTYDTGYLHITHNNTALNDADYRNAITDITLEFGSEDTGYEPYSAPNEITFTFPSTVGDNGVVYGGYLDTEKGEVVAEYAKIQLSDLTWSHSSGWSNPPNTYCVFSSGFNGGALFDSYNTKPWVCNALPSATRNEAYTGSYRNSICFTFSGTLGKGSPTLRLPAESVSSIEEAVDYIANNNITVAYKLATPIHYSLTPQSIATLRGDNVMWSDANGNITVRYWTR